MPSADTAEGPPAPVDVEDGRRSGSDPRPVTAPGTGAPAQTAPDRRTVQIRQRERFGGIKVGSAFFGWLTATGLAVILIVLLTAAGVGLGWVDQASASQPGTDRARTLGLVGGIVLLVILFVSYSAGGYVAGRMARFNGAKQGLVVWLWGVVTTGVIVILAAVARPTSDVVAGLDIPAFVNSALGLATGLGILAAALVALIGAIIGGLVGMRFHRRVDRAALDVVAAP